LQEETPVPRPSSRLVQTALAYLAAIACLIWLFHDVNWSKLLRDMAGTSWSWVALAIAFDLASYVFQAWRWELLLRPKGLVSTLKASQAVYAGLFANGILPMRVGEALRGYLVARWLPVPFAAVIPSVVVERLFDGVWLAIWLGVTAIFVKQLPQNLLKAADILGAGLLAATALFALVVFRKRSQQVKRIRYARFKWLRILTSFLATLEEDLRQIGRSRAVFASFGVSFLLLLGQVLAFWLVMWAYGLRLSFWAGSAVFLIVHIGTAVPNVPANLGTYQFFTVLGLELFGVEKTLATGFSLVVFFLLTFPLLVVGAFAVSRSGMTFANMRREIRRF
jgi:hypothetical protein